MVSNSDFLSGYLTLSRNLITPTSQIWISSMVSVPAGYLTLAHSLDILHGLIDGLSNDIWLLRYPALSPWFNIWQWLTAEISINVSLSNLTLINDENDTETTAGVESISWDDAETIQRPELESVRQCRLKSSQKIVSFDSKALSQKQRFVKGKCSFDGLNFCRKKGWRS